LRRNIIDEAMFVIETKKTIREAAKDLDISKSQLHRDLNEKLKDIDSNLYLEIKTIFLEHNKNKHINGGQATKLKYAKGD